jgi:uncharacterized protein YmfQ (DUF2313 family)
MFHFGQTFNAEVDVEARALLIVDGLAKTLRDELFPDGATDAGTMEDWERLVGINGGSSVTSEGDRRNAIIASLRATNAITVAAFESIAGGFGYTIGPAGTPGKHLRIVEGNQWPAFRAGISKAGDKVYSSYAGDYTPYTVRVYGTDVTTNSELQRIFNKAKPAGITFIFVNE